MAGIAPSTCAANAMISRPGNLAGLLVLLIACAEPNTSSSAEPFTVTDSAGVEV